MKKATYHIFWISEITQAQGEGTASFSKDTCKRLCADLNAKFPDLTHLAIEND